jgi:hypothetical protein
MFLEQFCNYVYSFSRAVKEFIDSETRKFMKSHMELFAAHHSLQHKMNKSSSECDVLLDSTVEMLQVATECSCMELFQYFCICISCTFS